MSSYGLSTSSNIASSTSPKMFFKTSRSTLWVHKANRLLTSLPLLRSNRFFKSPVCKKCFRIAFRHLVRSLHRHQSRILICSEDRLSVLWTIRLLNQTCPSRFFRFQRCRKWVCIGFQHLEKSLHRLHKRRFWYVQKADYEFAGPFAYLNFTLATPSNSLFLMRRMQKISSNGLEKF
jgi:hypothetical protein